MNPKKELKVFSEGLPCLGVHGDLKSILLKGGAYREIYRGELQGLLNGMIGVQAVAHMFHDAGSQRK